MPTQLKLLTAELNAIELWDRMFVDNPEPDLIDKEACRARFVRRLEIIMEMEALTRRN